MCFSKQLTKRVFHFENKKKLFFSFSLENKKTKTVSATRENLKTVSFFDKKNSLLGVIHLVFLIKF